MPLEKSEANPHLTTIPLSAMFELLAANQKMIVNFPMQIEVFWSERTRGTWDSLSDLAKRLFCAALLSGSMTIHAGIEIPDDVLPHIKRCKPFLAPRVNVKDNTALADVGGVVVT